jgi:membrane protease YdiL (CAAX protease family)
VVGPAPGVGYALPPDGVSYPQILRGESYVWWRSVVGVVFGLSFFLILTTVVSQALILLAWATTASREDYKAYYTSAYAFQRASGLLAANLGIATLIPIAAALMVLIHRVRPRWLVSVRAEVRWQYLLACLGVAAVVLNGFLLLSTLVTGSLQLAPQKGFWGFLAVIVLTSPLQAAAEEIFFRGYLMQALGSLFSQPWVGVVLSSVVFALFHGTQNVPLFIDRLAFGLVAAALVWRTGGLEAGIAAHVVNNVFAYGIAALTSSVAAVQAIRGIDWVNAAFDVGAFAVFAALALLLAHRMKLQTRVDLRHVR